jgi:hypothetical protein
MAWGEIRFFPDEAAERGEGQFFADSGVWLVHPADWLLQQGRGRFPFETRHSLGVRELERDRRRYPRA